MPVTAPWRDNDWANAVPSPAPRVWRFGMRLYPTVNRPGCEGNPGNITLRCSRFLRERVGVRGAWMRSGKRSVPPDQEPAWDGVLPNDPLTPTLVGADISRFDRLGRNVRARAARMKQGFWAVVRKRHTSKSAPMTPTLARREKATFLHRSGPGTPATPAPAPPACPDAVSRSHRRWPT